jgi:ABC-type antimicrobial peptide transport system permease subunit
MNSHFFKTILRNLKKHKGFAFINIAGLSFGITGALILFLVVRFDMGFNAEPDADRIFRMVAEVDRFGEVRRDSGIQYPFAEAFRTDFPELEAQSMVDQNFRSQVVSVIRDDGQLVRFEEADEMVFVEPEFFMMFPRRWLSGDPVSALSIPNSVVVSESIANKYFNTTDVMGKTIRFDGEPSTINGVISDGHRQSDFRFNIFRPFLGSEGRPGWNSTSSNTQYMLKLPVGMSKEDVESRLADFNLKHMEEEEAKAVRRYLQPLSELHYNDEFDQFFGGTVTYQELGSLSLVGILLILISCINFVNLNTALAVNRAKEVGLRKVMGSSRTQLIVQYMGETALITFISFLLALVLTELSLPMMQDILARPFGLDLFSDASILIFLIVLMGVVTLSAGLYPAFVLSSFQPIDALKHALKMKSDRGITLRKSLVVSQFIITQILIIGTLTIRAQMEYFRNADLGFDREAVVQTQVPARDAASIDRLKASLRSDPSILDFTFSNTGAASNGTWNTIAQRVIEGEEPVRTRTQFKTTDNRFISTYGVTLLAGSDFGDVDSLNGIIVNEQFLQSMNLTGDVQDAIGTPIRTMGRDLPIQGVMRNFNTTSLHDPINPVMLLTRSDYFMLAVRIDMQQRQRALATLEQAWTDVFPERIYEYQFLDDSIADFYQGEEVAARLMNIFTILTILIGSLGLFGLVSHIAVQRTKEIGIRKVMGAESGTIIMMFVRDFGTLLVVSFAIAAPISWWLMRLWLENFTYRIDVGPAVLLSGALLSVLIAAITVGYTTYTSSRANPIDSLRYE